MRLLVYDLTSENLSTPSLGITKRADAVRELISSSAFQLPLSGSQFQNRTDNEILLSFNSLSRDHSRLRRATARSSSPPFNSLSRDHNLALGRLLYAKYAGLSTPSLGITGSLPRAVEEDLEERDGLSTPSLGITRMRADDPLSRDPFNSLSRDHKNVSSAIAPTSFRSFNSLSRDHRARFRDFSALRGFLPRHPFAQMNLETTI
jgi:hypothetical protein